MGKGMVAEDREDRGLSKQALYLVAVLTALARGAGTLRLRPA
jgi:hypothetical protein